MSFIDQPGFADDVRAVLKDLLALPPAFMDYTVQYGALNGLPIPISQITGFTQFAAQQARVSARESTTSTTYVNLATTGPSITGLPNGKYVFVFGAGILAGAVDSAQCYCSISYNSSTPVDTDGLRVDVPATAGPNGGSSAVVATLSSGNNNNVKLQYRSGTGSTAQFQDRWLLGLKFSNA